MAELTLSQHCSAAIDQRISGKDPATAIKLFTTQDHTNKVYVRNPQFWGGDLDLACISPWNNDFQTRKAGVLISPQHYLCATHYAIGAGKTIRFITNSGEIVERTVLGSKSLPAVSSNLPDINVGILDSPINNIRPVVFLPEQLPEILNGKGVGILYLDQEEKGLIANLNSLGSKTVKLSTGWPGNGREFYCEQAISGDSGNPIFLVINNKLVLISTFTWGGDMFGPGGGTSITYYANEVQGLMNTLSTTHSQSTYNINFTDVNNLEEIVIGTVPASDPELPESNVFNVKKYGAVGDGVTDDTIPCRAAVSDAKMFSKANDKEAIVYFPEGIYGVSVQPSVTGIGFSDSFVFTTDADNITYAGDGVDKSEILFHTLHGETGQPMANPNNHWTILGDGRGYGKVVRGGLFQNGPVDPSKPISYVGNAPVNVTIRDLKLNGQARPTVNAAVGGVVLDFTIVENYLYRGPSTLSSGYKINFGKEVQDLPPELKAKELVTDENGVETEVIKHYYVTAGVNGFHEISETLGGEPISLVNNDLQFLVFQSDGGSKWKARIINGKMFVYNFWSPDVAGEWSSQYRKVLFGSNLGMPVGAELKKYYYMVNVVDGRFQLSETPDGSPIALSHVPDSGVTIYRVFNGRGWDMSNKGYALHGGQIDNINFINTRWLNWRGEIIHAGGDQPRNINFINSIFELTDASMISCGGQIVIDGCKLRNGYNGIENFSRVGYHGTTVINSTFTNDPALYAKPHFAIVYLGLPAAHAHIENNHFSGWSYGVFLSDMAFNVKILKNTFDLGNGTPLHLVNLGMYPNEAAYSGRMNDILVEGNTFYASNETPIYLQGVNEMQNFTIRNNKFLKTPSGRSWRFLMRQFVGSTLERFQNFVFEGNHFDCQAGVFPNGNAIRANFVNNTAWEQLEDGQMWPFTDNLYSTQTEGTVRTLFNGSPYPIILNNRYNDSRNNTMYYKYKMEEGPILNKSYPLGFKFKIKSRGAGFIELVPDGWLNQPGSVILDPSDIRFVPSASLVGSNEVEVIMTENGKFSVVGELPNLLPVITYVPTLSIEEGDAMSSQVTVAGGDLPLAYSLTGNPEWISINETGLISGTGVVGEYNFSVTVTDANGDTDTKQSSIKVVVKDTLPIISLNKTSSVVEEGQGDTIVSTVTNGNAPFEFFLEGNPAWVTVNEQGVVSITNSELGTYNITVGVVDADGDISKQSFGLVVKELDVSPEIVTTELLNAVVGEVYSTKIVAIGGNGQLLYTMSPIDGLSIEQTTGLITGTVSSAGEFVITVTVADQDGDSDSVDLTLVVSNPDLVPVLEQPSPVVVPEDQLVEIQLAAVGGDAPLTYSIVSGAPAWMVINAETGLISGTPTRPSNSDVRVRVTDVDGDYNEKVMSVIVEYVEPNKHPVIVQKVNEFTALRDEPFNLQYVAADGNEPLTWSMYGAPSWLNIDSATGLVYYDGTESNQGETGTFLIDIGVSDVDGDSSYTTLTLKITGKPYRKKNP